MTVDGKITVLLVDDDPHMRTSVGIHLRHLGFDVETAANGFEALGVLEGRTEPPGEARAAYDADVILLDLLMPVMTGYEFLERYPGPVPVVVMSGFAELASMPRVPFAVVPKPMSMIDVADTLRSAAGWRKDAAQ